MESLSGSRAATALKFLLCAGLLGLAGCGTGASASCPPSAPTTCVRVLFLGNSYTYANDLPGTFARLARAGGHEVQVAMVAGGGETLEQHASSAESLGKLHSQTWDFVVLQEQSETPASSTSASYFMYPAARELAGRARAAGATPMFFMTAAHRDGILGSATPSYETMQLAVDQSYLAIANELDAPVAPVGFTWFVVRRDHPEIGLWQDDGSHPSIAGTYLAACVFYASIFRHSPEGLAYGEGLPDAQASVLRTEAGRNVMDLGAQWGLP